MASLITKAGSSPQNLWPILYDIGASQVATQIRQFKNVYVVANVNWRQKYTFASNFEANVYFCLKLQTWRVKYTLAPNFEANVYFSLKLQTWRIKYTLALNFEANVYINPKLQT